MSSSTQLAMSLKDLISNPIKGTPAEATFSNACTAGSFAANAATYFIYSFLLIFLVYNLSVGIYKIATSEEKETFIKLQAALTNAVLAAVGLVLILSVLYLPVTALRLVGISDADNIFLKNCNEITQP